MCRRTPRAPPRSCLRGGRDMAPLPGLPRAQRPLPHVRVDRLVNETRDARFFDNLDISIAAIAMPDGLHATPGPGGGRTRTSTDINQYKTSTSTRHRPVQDIEGRYKTSTSTRHRGPVQVIVSGPRRPARNPRRRLRPARCVVGADALHAFDPRSPRRVIQLDWAGPTRCPPAGLWRAHARTVRAP